jgi:hypothetical protein
MAAVAVLALSAASSVSVVAARSFSTSVSATVSFDASESGSIAAALPAVWAVVARSSVDCRAASRDVCADASLAIAAAAATRAKTSCISN